MTDPLGAAGVCLRFKGHICTMAFCMMLTRLACIFHELSFVFFYTVYVSQTVFLVVFFHGNKMLWVVTGYSLTLVYWIVGTTSNFFLLPSKQVSVPHFDVHRLCSSVCSPTLFFSQNINAETLWPVTHYGKKQGPFLAFDLMSDVQRLWFRLIFI